MLPGKAGYHFLYSLNAIPKIFEYVFGIKYQILLLIFYSLFIFTTIKLYKKIDSNNYNLNKEMYTNDSKLFLIGGYFNLFLFIFFELRGKKLQFLMNFHRKLKPSPHFCQPLSQIFQNEVKDRVLLHHHHVLRYQHHDNLNNIYLHHYDEQIPPHH